MHFTSFALAALVGVAQATKDAVQVQVVSVGKNPQTGKAGLQYWPENIVAAPGSFVQFQFWVGNHTVTQSDFDHPCQPISQIDSTKEGVWSGFVPAAASADKGEIPTYTVQVNDTKPIWLFCSQGKHCQSGMAMVINQNTTANSSRCLSSYKSAAAGVTIPSDSGSGGSGGGDSSSGGGNGGYGGGYGGPQGGYNSTGYPAPSVPDYTSSIQPVPAPAPTSSAGSDAVGTGGLLPTASPTGVQVSGASAFTVSSGLLFTLGACVFALM
ncbi:Extracellular serine-rich protein [Cladobotryum mycophilum]|uniref:Extracellular serine-rich protein n=1 Tax=Cladobotryum mycophilum TaxID=491253 RepID=A0ABR0SYH7_9HYPO